MKSTGVTRRIDELGRIVIPKEIRRTLAIRDGENLEILIEGNKIILQKYLVMQNLLELSNKIIEVVSSVLEEEIIITDREKIIASSNKLKHLLNIKNTSVLLKYIDNRESGTISSIDSLVFDESEIDGYISIVPIINETDCLGLILIVSEENNSKENLKLAKIVSKILSEKININ